MCLYPTELKVTEHLCYCSHVPELTENQSHVNGGQVCRSDRWQQSSYLLHGLLVTCTWAQQQFLLSTVVSCDQNSVSASGFCIHQLL